MCYKKNEDIRTGLDTFSLRGRIIEYRNKWKDVQNDIQVVGFFAKEAVQQCNFPVQPLLTIITVAVTNQL